MNTGKDLEALVSRLEDLLRPDGFDLVVNRRVVDADGVQLAEFDIQISGVAGQRSVRWLIECRDRPSEGAAPSSWIEQLVGRRALHQLDEVIAVSTTGFSDAATRLAKRGGVGLRRVDNISDIASDFKVIGFHLVTCLIGATTLRADADGSMDFEFSLRDLLVRPISRPEPIRFAEFVSEKLESADWLNETRLVRIAHDQPIELRIGEKSIVARSLRADVEVTRQILEGTALAAKRYSDDDRVIGQEGLFAWELSSGVFRARIRVVDRADGTHACNVELLDALPDGWQGREMRVYGRNEA